MVSECYQAIVLYLQQILREYAVEYAGRVINRVEPSKATCRNRAILCASIELDNLPSKPWIRQTVST